MAEDLAVDTQKEAEETPQKSVRRWLLEIKLAQKREKDFREKGKNILKKYRGQDRKKNSFNILWANTEVLRPALYNSPPKPDVRRRFRQNDALGKAVSEVMERSLSYCTDAYDLDDCLKMDVLDALLPGRGISRVRYVPTLKSVGGSPDTDEENPHEEEAFEGDAEEVEYEQALCEHVQWDDYLQGPGKEWTEVMWQAFRHRPTKDDLIEQFGEDVAKKISLNDVEDSDLKGNKNASTDMDTFKRAELWEIWDKDKKRVFFINDSYKDDLLYPLGIEKGEPPLKLKGFFPTPRPLRMVEDTTTQIPQALYEQYCEQADELDRISTRINKVVNGLKIRGVYDSTLSELSELMKGEDNDLIPAEQARAWMTNGGLEKAIWWMPTQQAAAVLKELYAARDLAKQVIYEITGISDILRGQTNPNETLGAQQLKANSSSLRLQRMQREVQRYSRDLIRLLAEVIGEHFSPQTLGQMTGLQFPTAQQKQQGQLLLQVSQQQQQPMQPGQPPAAPSQQLQQLQQMLSMPSWDDIMGVLKSDMQREYRVDIETDSTVAQSLQQDMTGLKEVLTGVVEFWQGVGPAVQAGAVSMDAVKAITMTIVRRARMGLEVEDALESGMQQPKPQSDPKAQAEQAKQQQDASERQHQQAIDQRDQQHQQALDVRQQQHEEQIAQRDVLHQQAEAAGKAKLEEMQQGREDAFNRWKAELEAATKIMVAEIGAKASLDQAQVKATQAAQQDLQAAAKGDEQQASLADLHGKTLDALRSMMEQMSKPREIVRGPDGRAMGLRVVG